MKTLKGLINYKPYGFPALQIFPTSIALYLLLFISFSCNEKDESGSQAGMETASLNASSGKGGVETKSLSSTLGNLYLVNFNDTAKNQLTRLFSDESYNKLTFQTYKLKNGQLTLAVFAGKQNSKEFNPDFQVLGFVDDIVIQDIEDKEVFLGDQKLDNDTGLKMLKEAINVGSKNDSTKNYVIFTPELKRFSTAGNYVIEYSIRFTSSLEEFKNQLLSPASGRLNPSPPY
jgi:hypothetical protein